MAILKELKISGGGKSTKNTSTRSREYYSLMDNRVSMLDSS